MQNRLDPRAILRDEHKRLGSTIPVELAIDVYEVEERVQFDTTKRKDAIQRIRALVIAHLTSVASDGKSP